jgi:phosphoserine/homoserine phosphotransferase
MKEFQNKKESIKNMYIVCSDLEGVFTPEIWINVAEKTGISELRLTTRDISDYDVLMKKRIKILKENGIKLHHIKDVIAGMEPLEGAIDFLNWLKQTLQVILVSDTFVQFAGPMMKKLDWPTLFCNSLSVAPDDTIVGYNMRQTNGKRKTAIALKSLNYQIIAVGDSYNDIEMLKEGNSGILFNPPDNVVQEFPQFPCTYKYDYLKEMILAILQKNKI